MAISHFYISKFSTRSGILYFRRSEWRRIIVRVEGKAREICRSLLCYIAFLNLHVRILLFSITRVLTKMSNSFYLFFFFLWLFGIKFLYFQRCLRNFQSTCFDKWRVRGWRIGGWVEFNLKLFFLKIYELHVSIMRLIQWTTTWWKKIWRKDESISRICIDIGSSKRASLRNVH